jgi:small subunit ribosomal protein S3
MGQKINPNGFRLGVIRDWTARWYAGSKHYAENLSADIKLRDHIKQKLSHAALSKIIIERPAQNISITLHTARPGIVIGKKGEDIEKMRQELGKMAGRPVHVARRCASPRSMRSSSPRTSPSNLKSASCSGAR